MFTDYLKSIYESEELKALANKNFINVIKNWREENPEETVCICDDELNEKDLTLDCITISKADMVEHAYKKLKRNILRRLKTV